MSRCLFSLAGFAATLFAGAALADPRHDELSQQANDPTAALMSAQIADWYAPDSYGSEADSNQILLRVAMPFKIGSQQHIMRATLPFITDNPHLHKGLSDINIFDMMVFNQSWGRFGLGLIAALPTGGADRGAEKWGLGPAFGFVADGGNGILWGAFSQNVFTVAGDDMRPDVNVSQIQPIFNYKLGGGWTTGLAESQLVYDWEKDRWTSLPLGVNIAKLVRLGGKLPVQFRAEYEHNFQDEPGSAKNTVRLGAKFIFPTLF